MGTKQFSYDSIKTIRCGDELSICFKCAMVSSCKPIFNNCKNNYEVEEKLRTARVIHRSTATNTEKGALVVNFQSMNTAKHFIDRLNKYLEKKFELLTKKTKHGTEDESKPWGFLIRDNDD